MSKDELAKKILVYNFLLAELEDQNEEKLPILKLAKAEQIFFYKAELGISQDVQKELVEEGEKKIIDAIREFIQEDESTKGNNEFVQFHPGKVLSCTVEEGQYGSATYQFTFDYEITDDFLNVVKFSEAQCRFEDKVVMIQLRNIASKA